jgi:hypothetical protein
MLCLNKALDGLTYCRSRSRSPPVSLQNSLPTCLTESVCLLLFSTNSRSSTTSTAESLTLSLVTYPNPNLSNTISLIIHCLIGSNLNWLGFLQAFRAVIKDYTALLGERCIRNFSDSLFYFLSSFLLKLVGGSLGMTSCIRLCILWRQLTITRHRNSIMESLVARM